MPPDDRTRLLHMIEAAETAAGFVQGRTRSDLDRDPILAFALVRAIEIVGEAASKISVETRGLAPDIPWSSIVSMRNRLVHAYFDINHELVWISATEELPELLPLLRDLLAERGEI